MRLIRATARTMLAGIFISSGSAALNDPEPLVPRATPVVDRIAPWLERAVPALPSDATSLVRLNGAVQVVGGLLLATGRFRRLAALTLAGSLIPSTLAGHPFWQKTDPVERRMHQIHFLKNLGLFGGLLLAALDTEGRPGVAWRTRHTAQRIRRIRIRRTD